jgi:hypothetical protein
MAYRRVGVGTPVGTPVGSLPMLNASLTLFHAVQDSNLQVHGCAFALFGIVDVDLDADVA